MDFFLNGEAALLMLSRGGIGVSKDMVLNTEAKVPI